MISHIYIKNIFTFLTRNSVNNTLITSKILKLNPMKISTWQTTQNVHY